MKKTHALAGLVLGTALLGAGITNAFAADETLRSLAEKNGIYIGAILNSQWFSGGLPGNYEQIHKQQFNIVVAENEMKFDATEPQEGRFNYGNGDKMVKYAQQNGTSICILIFYFYITCTILFACYMTIAQNVSITRYYYSCS